MKKRADERYKKSITIDGKRKYFYGKSEREVIRKIKDYTNEKALGAKFLDIASEWKEEHFKTIRNGTRTSYTPAYDRAVAHFGNQRIGDIETREIYAFLHSVIKQKYSQKTVKTQKLVLNQIFNYAIICGDIESNPVTAIRLPSNLPKSQREIPTDETIEKIKNGVNNHFGLFAYLIIYTGCRRGEALALRYEDIDRERKIIKVTKSLEWVNNVTPTITLPKTEAGVREIILLDMLNEHIPNKEHGLLFPSSTGNFMP